MQKKALISGITGQDGSYLAELLIQKGYEVHGLVRRVSVPNRRNMWMLKNIKIIEGDLEDGTKISGIIKDGQYDEVYNLGAMSFVAYSFENPVQTHLTNCLGVIHLVQAIRRFSPHTRFYQASTSEMYGGEACPVDGYVEDSPFHPRSPYGESKLAAYWHVRNARDGYNLHASNGVLFNHETMVNFMPMFHRNYGDTSFNIKPICEIVEFNESIKQYQQKEVSGIQVWSKNGWVDVTCASAYPHDIKNNNKKPRFINGRNAAFMATSSHVVFMADGTEKETGDIQINDNLATIDLPDNSQENNTSLEEAELLGMMVGDGSISYYENKSIKGCFTNKSQKLKDRFVHLITVVTGGCTKFQNTLSGFTGQPVGQLRINGANDWLRFIDIYNKDHTKRVPKRILNASPEIMLAFLRGYNACDGLKANPCTYEFKNFKTNSATLAMGLWYLISKTTDQEMNLTVEFGSSANPDGIYYSINLLSPVDNQQKETTVNELINQGMSQREIGRRTGISRTFIRKIQNGGSACLIHHLRRQPLTVKKIVDMPEYNGWFYDLETSSGEFHCGVGNTHVHNSPRRGIEFVTQKVATAVADYWRYLQECPLVEANPVPALKIGNMDAQRDWGDARDYVRGMWLMLQQPKPDDYVLATGEAHTVREMIEICFGAAGIVVQWRGEGKDEKGYDTQRGTLIVEVDPRFYRPTDVSCLIGNASKARKILGWKPEISFEEMMIMMVDNAKNNP